MKDLFTKKWIIANSVDITEKYADGVLTLRSLHYQLVGIGMTNDIQHYKRVVAAMIEARWDGIISFEKFSDLDRVMVGDTKYEETDVQSAVSSSAHSIDYWMNHYFKNRWENQEYYPEVLIEKKALQGVFTDVCKEWDVALGACKGYPSLTFLNEAADRFRRAKRLGKELIIIYFGDYDPSGEDIPRSIQENLDKLGVEVSVKRIALFESQVKALELPYSPAKLTDSRTKNWNGIGQVELDAVKPEMLIDWCKEAIEGIFDQNLYSNLLDIEKTERKLYQNELKEFVLNIQTENNDDEN
jgi:hypothetical protein